MTGAIPESVALPPLLTRVKGLTWRSVIFRGRRRRSGCEKIIEECGRKAVLLPGDLSDEKFARSLVHEAHKALGGLDIMALVAGKQVAIPDIADLTSEQFQKTFAINVFALFWLTREAIPCYRKVQVSSPLPQSGHTSQARIYWTMRLRRRQF